MAVYKVSIVITDGDYPGAILNLSEKPVVGDILNLAGGKIRVIEVIELMPPKGDFHFLHLTCQPAEN